MHIFCIYRLYLNRLRMHVHVYIWVKLDVLYRWRRSKTHEREVERNQTAACKAPFERVYRRVCHQIWSRIQRLAKQGSFGNYSFKSTRTSLIPGKMVGLYEDLRPRRERKTKIITVFSFVLCLLDRYVISILHMRFGGQVDNILEELTMWLWLKSQMVQLATALTRRVFSIGFVLLLKRP